MSLLERWEIVKMSDILLLETQYPVNHFFYRSLNLIVIINRGYKDRKVAYINQPEEKQKTEGKVVLLLSG